MRFRIGILATHPIQYQAPWYRAIASHPELELQVYYMHRQSANEQADAGFGVPFDWNTPLLNGYASQFLVNESARPGLGRFGGCDVPSIARQITDRRFDAFLVQGWNYKGYWQAARACRLAKTPLLIRGDSHLLTKRRWLTEKLKYPLYRMLMPRAGRFLAVGKLNAEYYRHYGVAPEKIVHVPHCVDNDYFARGASHADRAVVRQKWNLPPSATVALFVGKFIPGKRLEDFIHAVAKASSEARNLFGLVVGDGPLRSGLQRLCEQRKWPLKFTGFLNQKEMVEAYRAAEILVVPSQSETWGLTVNEAMATGLPAIVSDRVGCGPDLVVSGLTGEIFPVGDIQSLSGLLNDVAQRPPHWKDCGERARKQVDTYSPEAAVKALLSALTLVSDQPRMALCA